MTSTIKTSRVDLGHRKIDINFDWHQHDDEFNEVKISTLRNFIKKESTRLEKTKRDTFDLHDFKPTPSQKR